MIVSIGSKNPAKIAAVQSVFQDQLYEIKAVETESGVRAQPLTDEETIKGAINRAISAAHATKADIGIGLEGGVQQTEYGLVLCNWGALKGKDMDPIIAGGARIPLPNEIAERLMAGEELGPVMDEYAKKQNVRKKEGAIGIFTNGRLNRDEMFTHVVKLLVGQFEYKLNHGK
ncbi:DUF84 family protein [Mesobacillus maritimus]|uniref:DUF84 family protein n=1 Tax=Mesobacillus maritimus TaxID=1643336 RepID=UPI00204073D6|nr:DUF84 family protein [Mesobacillus maritimus]MCM3587917.1 DUF84 family protein [Mesobacillus maritimus]MCM3670091.1 DUF84 family protein [Mesobacillus maritimus]